METNLYSRLTVPAKPHKAISRKCSRPTRDFDCSFLFCLVFWEFLVTDSQADQCFHGFLWLLVTDSPAGGRVQGFQWFLMSDSPADRCFWNFWCFWKPAAQPIRVFSVFWWPTAQPINLFGVQHKHLSRRNLAYRCFLWFWCSAAQTRRNGLSRHGFSGLDWIREPTI